MVGGIARVWVFLGVEHPSAARATGHVVLAQAHTMVRYLALFLFPAQQTIVPVVSPILSLRDARVFEALAGLTVALIAVILTRRRAPLASFGLAFFFLLLVPSSALKVLSEFGQMMSEHRTYVASFGLFMAAGTGLSSLAGLTGQAGRSPRGALATAFATVLVVLTALSISRNRVWADPVSLWTDAVEKAPQTWLPLQGLAEAHRQAGSARLRWSPISVRSSYCQGRRNRILAWPGVFSIWGVSGRRRDASAGHRPCARERADCGSNWLFWKSATSATRGEALRLCQSALALAPIDSGAGLRSAESAGASNRRR